MSLHTATVVWERGQQTFTDNRYSRVHAWRFDGGMTVTAAASPHIVRVPYTDPRAVDPEEAFVVSIASCHMLWFLTIAAKRGFLVDSYRDEVIGKMDKNDEGKMAIVKVTLRPQIQFAGDRLPTAEQIHEMHRKAHEECFIANSVKCPIVWE